MDLRSGAGLHPIVVQHDHRRAGGPAAIRAIRECRAGRDDRSPQGRGVPARPSDVPPALDGCGGGSAVAAVLLPAPLLLRRAPRTRPPAERGRRAGRAGRRGDRAGEEQAIYGRTLAPGESAPWGGLLRHGRPRGQAQPLEYPPGNAGTGVARPWAGSVSPPMAHAVKWGILSTGNINRKVIPGAHASAKVELVAVASPDQARADDSAKTREIARAQGSYAPPR